MSTPGSYSRLPDLAALDLDTAQRELYEALIQGPRAHQPGAALGADPSGALSGPFNAMLLSPALGMPLQALGAAIRFRSCLSDRARELAILTVAHRADCAFEIYAHEIIAREIGLVERELTAVRTGTLELLGTDGDRAVCAVAAMLSAGGDLTDGQYLAACATLGEAALFELSTLVGYYQMLALQLRLFGVADPTEP